ncbi:HAD hydrolase-like protein [Plantactinospora alkalitolerans]|nr:HAD hydrolase-like protein [Plantactinospora alkalitolerans]
MTHTSLAGCSPRTRSTPRWSPPQALRITAQRCGTSITGGGWMIGDDPILDVAGGRRAGLRTIWLQTESTSWPEHQPGPDNTVVAVADAVEVLLQTAMPAMRD